MTASQDKAETSKETPSSRAFLAVLGVGLVATIGILVAGRGGDEAPAAAPNQALAPNAAGNAASRASATKLARATNHDAAWERTVNALAAVERHLNRTKLTFDEIDALLAKAVQEEPPRPMMAGGGRPTEMKIPPKARRVGNLHEDPSAMEINMGAGAAPEALDKPPPGVEWMPSGGARNFVPESQAQAMVQWREWQRTWPEDLAAARGLLPALEGIDPDLHDSHAAVSALLDDCLKIPNGNPPTRPNRDEWLTGLRAKVEEVRAQIDAAR